MFLFQSIALFHCTEKKNKACNNAVRLIQSNSSFNYADSYRNTGWKVSRHGVIANHSLGLMANQ